MLNGFSRCFWGGVALGVIGFLSIQAARAALTPDSIFTFDLPTSPPGFRLDFTISHTNDQMRGWDTHELVFDINYSKCTLTEGQLNSVIDAAINLWNGVGSSGLKLVRGSSSSATYSTTSVTTGNPVIFCLDATDYSASSVSVDGTPGFTRNHLSTELQIDGSSLSLNATGGQSDLVNLSEIQQQIVLAHEMGHVLGIGHASATEALMYFSIGYKEHLRLSQDDRDAITYLYPRNELGQDGLFGCGTIQDIHSDGKWGGGLGVVLFIFWAWIVVQLAKRRVLIRKTAPFFFLVFLLGCFFLTSLMQL